jgi:hypothetical protein
MAVLSPFAPLRACRSTARWVGLSWLCVVCFVFPTRAQQAPPASEPTNTDAHASASALPSVPSPESAARLALQQLDLRETTLKADLDRHPLVLPGLALGVGIPATAVMVPIGALLLADAGDASDPGSQHSRRVGALVLGTGALAFAAAIYGSIQIAKLREQRRHAQYELRAISVQRLMLGTGSAPARLSAAAQLKSEELPTRRRGTSLTSRGRVLLTGGFDLSLFSKWSDGDKHWGVGIEPGFGYFVRDRLAFGAFTNVSRSEEDFDPLRTRRDRSVGAGMRMIYEIVLGERTGLWLWPYFGYLWQNSEFRVRAPSCGPTITSQGQVCSVFSHPLAKGERTEHLFRFGLLLPVMFHLTEHWGLGAGPRAEFGYALSGNTVTNMGFSSQLLGSF